VGTSLIARGLNSVQPSATWRSPMTFNEDWSVTNFSCLRCCSAVRAGLACGIHSITLGVSSRQLGRMT
jgi:hypothetical protein